MPKRIEVGDLVLKTGNYYGLDMDYGLVTEVLKDKYTDTRYLQVHWLYDKHTETVKEEEVKLYKKTVKEYGKFKDKEGPMSVEEWLREISEVLQRATKDRGR